MEVLTSTSPKLLRLPGLLRRAYLRAVEHDLFNLAQATAYSAIVALFPALIVIAAIIGLLPDTAPIRFQLAAFFDRIVPSDVSPILQTYFVEAPHNTRSGQALLFAFIVSFTGAAGVIANLMEGLRRAHRLPSTCWSITTRTVRAYLLVLVSLLPFVITTILVVFGHYLTQWIAMHVMASARTPVYLIALVLRWTVALAGSVGLICVLFHFGTPMNQTWKRSLPGAIAATALWFLSTLAFGWYVTRFANYSQVYGSLGACIALLFWLYLIALSLLCGAELNAVLNSQSTSPTPNAPTSDSP